MIFSGLYKRLLLKAPPVGLMAFDFVTAAVLLCHVLVCLWLAISGGQHGTG